MTILIWVLASVMLFPSQLVDEQPAIEGYDLEASEVVCHKTDNGQRYFSYRISNVGDEDAPEGSYMVFFKVNGKMVSYDTNTDGLEAGKSVVYTSDEKFSPFNKKGRLKYQLIINTKDSNKENNKKKGNTSLNFIVYPAVSISLWCVFPNLDNIVQEDFNVSFNFGNAKKDPIISKRLLQSLRRVLHINRKVFNDPFGCGEYVVPSI